LEQLLEYDDTWEALRRVRALVFLDKVLRQAVHILSA